MSEAQQVPAGMSDELDALIRANVDFQIVALDPNATVTQTVQVHPQCQLVGMVWIPEQEKLAAIYLRARGLTPASKTLLKDAQQAVDQKAQMDRLSDVEG